MSDDALSQVLDAFGDVMAAMPALSGETIKIDLSADEAVEDDILPCWIVYAEAYDFNDAPNQGQTQHDALINFERIETSANVGMVSRANRNAIASLIAGLHEDPTLGGRLQDLSTLNVAPPMDNGKSIGGASLQVKVTFFTPLGDHFTIVI